MIEDIAKAGARHVDDVRSSQRDLVEKALRMRCLAYLSQVKARLLTETILEVDQSKKSLLIVNREMARQREYISQQKVSLEEKNCQLQDIREQLEERVAERTADLAKTNQRLRSEIEERKRAEAQLRDSEERGRNLLETAPDAMVIVDRQGAIVFVNRQVQHLFGYTKDELIGRPVEVLIPDKLRDRHVQHRAAYAEQPHVRSMGKEHDLCGLHKDGITIPVEISLGPLQTGDGLLISAAIRDISERKRLEDELHEYHDHLEELVAERTAALTVANQELEGFSYSVSHDLRAPLRTIDGFSFVLAEDYADKLDDTAKAHIQRVRHAAQRMSRLIDDLLQLSRVSRGVLKRQRIDMSALAGEILDLHREADPEREVNTEIEADMDVYADEGLLRVVLDNLFDNAWKFTARREHARIEFGREQREGGTVFVFRDNGVGFDMDYSDRLFSAFQRLHSQDEFEGTGVGLATVQRIIRRHGGEIWAESTPGEGATFYFTLRE